MLLHTESGHVHLISRNITIKFEYLQCNGVGDKILTHIQNIRQVYGINNEHVELIKNL